MRILDQARLNQNIEQIAKYDLDNNNVFGSSYFVYQNGNTVFKKHFGKTNLDENKDVDDSTIYRLASMTKPITAIAMLILAERGQISLDDPVGKYIHGFNRIHIINADGHDLGISQIPITISHCLSHTSGFGSGGKPVTESEESRKTFLKTIDCYMNAGLDFTPFSKQAYSPWAAFDILGAIVEKVTNQDYEEFLRNEIFIPCDMLNTTFSPSEKQWLQVIAMHNKVNGKNDIGATYSGCVFENFPCSHKLAGAGLVSTLDDYSNFARMLLGKGQINNTRIISEETFQKLSHPYIPKEIMPGNERWGLGVRVIVDKNYQYLPVGSFGWSGAYGSHFWIDPQNQICAVFMKNSKFDGGSANQSAQRFEEAVFNALI